ncbi:MAG: hypothetical protein KDB53_16305 [Planctomycetes bacterium]|nr:hypothetical protein [Planctomycetota bacterium]
MLMRFKVLVGILVVAWSTIVTAQEFEIRVPELEGFRESGGSRRRILTRRFPKLGTRIRMSVGIEGFDGADVAAFLDGQGREGEVRVPAQDGSVTLAGRTGQRRAFSGQVKSPRGDLNGLRRVNVVRVADKQFLVVEVALTHEGDEAPPLAKTQALEAEGAILAGLKLLAAATDEGTAEPEPAMPDQTVTYRNETVFPVELKLPGDWYLAEDTVQAPGRLWVLATPFRREAQAGAWNELPAALRLTVSGHETLLFGSALGLDRAVRLVRSELEARHAGAPITIEVAGETLVGRAKARLLSFRHAEDSGLPSGWILVAVAESSLITAEIRYDPDLEENYSNVTLQILESLQATFERNATQAADEAVLPFRTPPGWTNQALETEDESDAWNVTSPEGCELVIRGIDLPKDSPLRGSDLEPLRRVVASYLNEELETHDQKASRNADVFGMPGVGPGLRVARFDEQRFEDLFAFVREGRLWVAHLLSPAGTAGRDHGLALRCLLGLGATNPAPPVFQLDAAGAFLDSWEILRHDILAFDASGVFRSETHRLGRQGQGRVRLDGQPVSLRIEGKRLVVSSAEGAVLLGLSPDRSADPAILVGDDGTLWVATPRLR